MLYFHRKSHNTGLIQTALQPHRQHAACFGRKSIGRNCQFKNAQIFYKKQNNIFSTAPHPKQPIAGPTKTRILCQLFHLEIFKPLSLLLRSGRLSQPSRQRVQNVFRLEHHPRTILQVRTKISEQRNCVCYSNEASR